MREILFYIAIGLCLSCATVQKTDKTSTPPTVIVGTIHVPTGKINADSIYNILYNFRPDIILVEAESNIFEKENTFKNNFDGMESNEFQGILKYQKENPAVAIKPAELANRNKIREQLGIYSEAGFVFSEVDQLKEKGRLSNDEKHISADFDKYWDLASNIGRQTLSRINTKNSDVVIDSLMQFQYHIIGKIVNRHKEFDDKKIKGSNGDSISYKNYYNKWANFEGKIRNEGIANNVLKYRKQYPNKKILLFVGYKHRFFIRHYLEKQIKLQEYYE